MYNLTKFGLSQNLLEMVIWVNDATYQVLFSFFMVGLFFIFLLALKKYPFEHALISASWICLLLSLFLTLAGLVNFLFPLAFLLIAAFTGLYIFKNKGR